MQARLYLGTTFRLNNGRGEFLLLFVPGALLDPDIHHSQFRKHPNILKQLSSMASQHPLVAASAKFPKPAERNFQYGTAGVRFQSNHKTRLNLADMMLI